MTDNKEEIIVKDKTEIMVIRVFRVLRILLRGVLRALTILGGKIVAYVKEQYEKEVAMKK